MSKKAFDKIMASMEDALAYAGGDTSRGVAHVVKVVDVAAIRKAQGLSQSQFAARYGLDITALQQWEQKRRQPDRAARVLLQVIEHNPKAVEEALAN